MFTDANKQSLSRAFTCVNRISAAFRNVNTSPPNVGGDVSKTSQVQSTYCADHQASMICEPSAVAREGGAVPAREVALVNLVARFGLETDSCGRTRCSRNRFSDWSGVHSQTKSGFPSAADTTTASQPWY